MEQNYIITEKKNVFWLILDKLYLQVYYCDLINVGLFVYFSLYSPV